MPEGKGGMKRHRKPPNKNSPFDELTSCLEVVTTSFLNARKTLESMLSAIESASDDSRSDYIRLYTTCLTSIRRDINSFREYYKHVSAAHPEITKDPQVQELVGYITEQRRLIEKYFLETPIRGPLN